MRLDHYCRRCGKVGAGISWRNPYHIECGIYVELNDADLLKSDRDFKKEQKRQAKNRSHRRCVKCGKINPPTRYYKCEDCLQPSWMPTESIFDSFAGWQKMSESNPIACQVPPSLESIWYKTKKEGKQRV